MIERGYVIDFISADGCEKADTLLLRKWLGVETGKLSVDYTSEPQRKLRFLVSEGRVDLPSRGLMRRELKELEMFADGKRVNHPEKRSDGTPGSKDMADGVLWSPAECFEQGRES
jgi:hypothetical protein